MRRGWIWAGLPAGLVFAAQALEAQVDLRDRRLPLGPNRLAGEAVAPFFEGWYENPDGSYTLSFGYFNFNAAQALEIPIGPDNMIEPSEFGGLQPTYFPPPAERRGRGPGGYDRRERGVFTVTVPADFALRTVVWTLRVNDETHQVTARVGNAALQLGYGPRAMGSLPPLLGFSEHGPRGQHPRGITLDETLTTSAGRPLSLAVWVSDPSSRSKELLDPLYREIPIRLTWFMHQGPVGGQVIFEPLEPRPVAPTEDTGAEGAAQHLESYQNLVPAPGGKATMTARFSRAGDYVLRVRADNWTAEDSTPGDQCCWTNGYVRVRVR